MECTAPYECFEGMKRCMHMPVVPAPLSYDQMILECTAISGEVYYPYDDAEFEALKPVAKGISFEIQF